MFELELEDLNEPASILDASGSIVASNSAWMEHFLDRNVLEQLAGNLKRRTFRSRLVDLFQGKTAECKGEFPWSPGLWVQALARPLRGQPERFLIRLSLSGGTAEQRVVQSLLDQMSDGVFLLDPADGAIVYANEALLQLLEVSSKKQLLRSGQLGPMFLPKLLPELCRRLELTGPMTLEVEQKTLSGRAFAARIQVLSLAGGSRPMLAGILEEASKVSPRTTELLASGARLQSILQASPVAIVTFTLEGLVATWSPAAESIYGWSAGEVLLRPSPFGLEVAHQILPELLSGAPHASLRVSRQSKSGDTLQLSLSVSGLLDELGQIIGWLEVSEDITNRERADQLASNARQLESRESERLGLAREIHDGPMQDLLIIGFALAEVERVAGKVQKASLEPVQVALKQVSIQLRSVLHRLRPGLLMEQGVARSLQVLLDQCASQVSSQPLTRLEVEQEIELTPDQDLCIYRIVQEAYQNVLRHSRANRVDISLRAVNSTLELSVADDGRGFETPHRLRDLARGEHYGLLGMEERAALCGGSLSLESAPERGTRILVRLPLETGQ